jgi:hypothetical protein
VGKFGFAQEGGRWPGRDGRVEDEGAGAGHGHAAVAGAQAGKGQDAREQLLLQLDRRGLGELLVREGLFSVRAGGQRGVAATRFELGVAGL